MKKLHKLLVVVIAVVLVFAFTTTAFATEYWQYFWSLKYDGSYVCSLLDKDSTEDHLYDTNFECLTDNYTPKYYRSYWKTAGGTLISAYHKVFSAGYYIEDDYTVDVVRLILRNSYCNERIFLEGIEQVF